MVSFIKAIGLSLSSMTGSHFIQTRAQIQRKAISPNSDKERGKLDTPWAVGLVKGMNLYKQNWQNSFWKAVSNSPSTNASTLGDLIFEVYMLNEDVLEWEVQDGFTLNEFFSEHPKLCYEMIVNKHFPIESIEEKDRIALALMCLEEKGNINAVIQCFGIQNEQALLDIAHRSLAKDKLWGYSLENIKNFGFKDQKSIYSLLEARAGKFQDGVISSVLSLDITDKAELIKLAKLCSETKETTYSFFEIFSNQSKPAWSKEDWWEAISVAIKNDPRALLQRHTSWEYSIEPLEILRVIARTHPQIAMSEGVRVNFVNPLKNEDLVEIFQIAFKQVCGGDVHLEADLKSLDILLKQIINYRSPQVRKSIFKLLSNFEDKNFLKSWSLLIKGNSKNAVVHTMIPALLALSRTQDVRAPFTKDVFNFIDTIRKERDHFKNASNMHLLVNFLVQVNSTQLFADLHRVFIIKQVFADKDISYRLSSLTTFLYLQQEGAIAKYDPITNEILNKMCHELVCGTFKLNKKNFGGVKEFDALWHTRVESKFRDKDALMVYAGKINMLGSGDKEVMQTAFSQFITALLKDEYYQLRNQSPQMLAIRKLKGGEALAKEWSTPPQFEALSSFLQATGTKDIPFAKQFKKFLKEKLLADHHVEGFSKRLPYLDNYLNKKRSKRELLKDIEKIPSEKRSPEIELQKCCLELSLSKNKDDKLLENLQETLKTLVDKQPKIWDELHRDVTVFVSSLKMINKENMTIGVTNDPCDMLLLARETGGCQSIDGDPELNKCALAYVIDGKNCAVAIKDKDGRIKARAILRLLIDEKTKRPVLFLERHYLSINDPSLSEAINSYAIKYAKGLSLTLLTTDAVPAKSVYKKHGPIVSVGSNAPFEYSDAGGGRTEGSYTIPSSLVLYDPA